MMSIEQSWPTLGTSYSSMSTSPTAKPQRSDWITSSRSTIAFLDHMDQFLKAGRNIVICGDVNTAHKEMDLARPKANEKISGFLPVGESLDRPAGGARIPWTPSASSTQRAATIPFGI